MMYAVIEAPLVVGAVQVTVTLSGANEVDGMAGSDGIAAAKTVVAVDIAP
jgi:hypothetical protein